MRRLTSGIFASMLMAAPALASANVSCRIDDGHLRFELEAIAGRAGPITHVQDGTIEIKPAAVKLASPHIAFDLTHIVQQWSLGGDMRLQIEVGDEAGKQNVNLVILARLNEKTDKYAGHYVLKIAI
ncbi:MAG TPA: hypothetical protein VJZ74_01270, partial [Pseudolabrys sp.]|nr:hypothetical protein [Pseudolabrys sp.]